jgi:hypothetical protein
MKKTSKVKKECGQEETYWGDHLYLEQKFTVPEDLKDQKITLSVLNHKSVLADALIGAFDLDLL